MAGHSKWANIQHRKGRQDEKRGKVWTRLTREIIVAARSGGGDVAMNPRLRLAIDKAKAANMPADNIKRNIDKATGNLEGVTYEEIRYEGYGIGGAAIIVDCMTDNPTRTVAEVRHAFSKLGGSLGTSGSVAYMFSEQGQLLLELDDDALEEKLLELALDAGADDVISDGGIVEVVTAPAQFAAVKAAVDSLGVAYLEAAVVQRPATTVAVQGEDAERVAKLIERLEELDDVQSVYANADWPD